MPRPDQSHFLAHFTKNGEGYNPSNRPDNPSINQMSALERLCNILTERKIVASTIPWTKQPAVCFTECPWGSLIQHAKRYSPYGIGFSKKLVYSKNGNPVIYANPTLYNSQKWDKDVYPFLTPFVPSYAPDEVKNTHPFNGMCVDFAHEREWRVTTDFEFKYKYIHFVILNSVIDLQMIPEEIISEIGIEKFIFMDTYKKIEELWPTHIME